MWFRGRFSSIIHLLRGGGCGASPPTPCAILLMGHAPAIQCQKENSEKEIFPAL